MKKLNKKQITEKEELASKVTETRDKLEEAVGEFNEKVTDLFGKVEEARDDFNQAVVNAKEFCDNLAIDMDNFMTERSEKWQEGDAGQAYATWKDSYSNITIEEIELRAPDDLEVSDAFDPQEMLDLPDQPD